MYRACFFQSNWVIRLTLILHLTVIILLMLMPSIWPWLLTTILINHLIITAIGLWPRSQLLGQNWVQLPKEATARNAVALTIDDGPDPDVTPKVLEILEQYHVKATFFCIGEKVARHPHLAQQIIKQGHAIENHTQHHRHHFAFLGPNGFTNEIQAAQRTITQITGQTPQFFRAPAGLRNPFLNPVLEKLNLTLASWSVRGFDTKNKDAKHVKSTLLDGLKAGAILLLHDGNAALSQSGTPIILAVLPDLLNTAIKQNLHFITLRQSL